MIIDIFYLTTLQKMQDALIHGYSRQKDSGEAEMTSP